MSPLKFVGAFVTAVSVALSPVGAQCQLEWQPGPPLAGVNGFINEMIAGPASGTCFAVGLFAAAGSTPANNVAFWDGTSWQAVGGGVDGEVFDCVLLPNGDLVVGGTFTMAGGVAANNVARWDGTSWSPMGAGLGAFVKALLAMPNGDVVAAGGFLNSGSTSVIRLGRWNGSAWSQFATPPSTTNINAMDVLPNGDVVVAGLLMFPVTAGQLHPFAIWDGSSWTMPVSQFGLLSDIKVLPNGDLAMAGTITSSITSFFGIWDGTNLQGETTPLIARKLAVDPNGDIYAVGNHLSNTTVVARRSNGVWSSLLQRPRNKAAIAFSNGQLFVGGQMEIRPDGIEPSAWSYDGTSWQEMGGAPNPLVFCVAGGPGNTMYVGGSFSSIDGVAADNVAYFDGTSWHPLGLGVDGEVFRMALSPVGDLVVTGLFLTAGGLPAQRVARWDGSNWSAFGTGFPSVASDVAISPGGEIAICDSTNIAIFNGVSWNAVPLPNAVPGVPNQVRSLAFRPGGELVYGGILNGADVQVWDGFQLTGLGPPLVQTVFRDLALTASGEIHRLIADFGAGAMHVEQWNGSSWQALPSISAASAFPMTILPTGEPVVVSYPTGSIDASILVWDGTAWNEVDGGATGAVGLTAQANDLSVNGAGELLMVSSFSAVGDEVSAMLARAVSTCPATATPVGAGCVGVSGVMDLRAQNDPWIGTTVRSYATGFGPTSIGVHLLGTSAINAPLPSGGAGCQLLVDPVFADVLPTWAGVAVTAFTIPNDPMLAGQSFRTQVVSLELDASLTLIGTTSTNALDLTIGSY